jgi:hypothetical protein
MIQNQLITILDWLLAFFYILVIYAIAAYVKNKYVYGNPMYNYFLWGLFAKVFGGISVCLIYVYYYTAGGDTLSYNSDSSVLLKLLFTSPENFFKVWLSPLTKESLSYFNSETGYLMYTSDANTFMVDRLLVPLKLLSFNSYLVSSILMAVISFTGVWKLYCVFCDYYPHLYKYFAITVLFIPSVFFWGSGLLKDSWTIAGAGWYFYSFYKLFIKGENLLISSITLTISAMVLILIKPYIFLGLLPGTLLWVTWGRLSKIRNQFLKLVIAPVIIAAGMGIGFLTWSLTSSNLGQYSTIDSMLQKAVSASEDLKQDYYQGNSFDLGHFEPTIEGVLSRFPIGIATGLFRPFLWESRNPAMIASGLENALMLIFVVYVFFRKPVIVIRSIFSNPLILFCLIFAIFFAFSVAISTSNFGAMVRLRIPMMPFFLSGLVIIEYANSLKDNKSGTA